MSIRASTKSLVAGYQPVLNFSRHILPPLMGVLTIVGLLVSFNMPLITANYNFYHASNSSNASISQPFKPKDNNIIINKIQVNAPVVYGNTSNESGVFQLALRSGVVHYAGTALPGQAGNVALFGHSSGVVWEPGNYKFVFTLLNKLQPGDTIIIDYNSTRYIYKITSKEVVSPTDINILKPSDPQKHALEVITCTPVGTSLNRLVVHAEQLYPAP